MENYSKKQPDRFMTVVFALCVLLMLATILSMAITLCKRYDKANVELIHRQSDSDLVDYESKSSL